MRMREIIQIVEGSDPLRMFRMGYCDAMAIALHERYGFPLAVWRGFFPDEFGDEEDEAFEDAHMCVVLPGGRWADVDGVHSGQPDNLAFNEPVERIELVPISREEAEFAITPSGVEPETIELAKQHLPELSK